MRKMIKFITKTVYGIGTGGLGTTSFESVIVEVDNTTVDLGLLTRDECKELACTLREAADEVDPLDN